MMKRSVPSASLLMTQKLEAVADRPDDYTVIQRDLNRLENWMQSSLMKFNKGDSKPSV